MSESLEEKVRLWNFLPPNSVYGKFGKFQPKLQVKNDWYQTEAAVIITIMVKNIKEEFLKLDIDENKVKVLIDHPDFEICDLCFNLSHKVVPTESSFKVYSTKVSNFTHICIIIISISIL